MEKYCRQATGFHVGYIIPALKNTYFRRPGVMTTIACGKKGLNTLGQSSSDRLTTKKKRARDRPESDFFFHFTHHHYVPCVVNKSAVMDFHRSQSCATLIQSLYDIFVHSLMLSVHIVLGLPRPLLPLILPSISNRCTPFPLIICPKY